MKNRDKDALPISQFLTFLKKYFFSYVLKMKKLCFSTQLFPKNTPFGVSYLQIDNDHFFKYITSCTSLMVRGTSGKAAATRLGA